MNALTGLGLVLLIVGVVVTTLTLTTPLPYIGSGYLIGFGIAGIIFGIASRQSND